ncbi:MAG TPA: hypothetical protein VFX38_00490 [Gammaproteobacteria bacterium]|nr:hypothetical protein [Gammaproteobacteria bacterium]
MNGDHCPSTLSPTESAGLRPAGSLLCADTGLALVRIAGRDATAFLDAQCTAAIGEDCEAVTAAALADAKGRVLAVFLALPRGDDEWLLAVTASEEEWLREHLARFVFRSRVAIAPATDLRPIGLLGPDADRALAAAGLPAPAESRLVRAGPLLVCGIGSGRGLVIGEDMALADAARALAARLDTGDLAAWTRARLLTNEVAIVAATRARFLPQMLGLVERGAVSFRKGCYPGQEIIARTQHLGRVKRGLALFRGEIAPVPGAAQETERGPAEVLDGVALPAGGFLIQAVAPLAGDEDSQPYNGVRQ